MYDIKNFDELYKVYGGAREAANHFCISQRSLYEWRKHGIVSAGRRAQVICSLVDQGKTFDPLLFGMRCNIGALKLLTYVEKYRGDAALLTSEPNWLQNRPPGIRSGKRTPDSDT